MALQDILDKIRQEAENKISQLEKDFESKKKQLDEENAKVQKEIDENMHNRVEDKKQKILGKAETLAEREGKNGLLSAKREVIDAALEETIESLSKSDKYESILIDMLKQATLEDDGTVVVPAKGKEDATKKAIKDSGKNYFLSDKSADIKGGFILKTDKIEVDNSFETIINEQLREDLEIKLNLTLFA